jgi:hypothetical protein
MESEAYWNAFLFTVFNYSGFPHRKRGVLFWLTVWWINKMAYTFIVWHISFILHYATVTTYSFVHCIVSWELLWYCWHRAYKSVRCPWGQSVNRSYGWFPCFTVSDSRTLSKWTIQLNHECDDTVLCCQKSSWWINGFQYIHSDRMLAKTCGSFEWFIL